MFKSGSEKKLTEVTHIKFIWKALFGPFRGSRGLNVKEEWGGWDWVRQGVSGGEGRRGEGLFRDGIRDKLWSLTSFYFLILEGLGGSGRRWGGEGLEGQ